MDYFKVSKVGTHFAEFQSIGNITRLSGDTCQTVMLIALPNSQLSGGISGPVV